MTIRKGEEWGSAGPIPDDVVDVAGDREAAEVIGVALAVGATPPPVRLHGGDLLRTVGGANIANTRHDEPGPEAISLPIDVIEVDLDGRREYAVAHVSAHTVWWIRPTTVVMNAAFLGDWNLSPKSHPDDARLEVLEGRMSISDRWNARDRLRSGTHLPHPGLSLRRVESVSCDLGRPTPVWLDGQKASRCTQITARALVDAATLII